MPARLEAAAREALASRIALMGRLPAGHWMRPHHATASATYSRVVAFTAERLRLLGHPIPRERIAA